MDYVSGKHKGFAFCEFEDPEDAEEAIFNMDGAELLGRFLKVSLAQPNQVSKLSVKNNEAIWKSDEWFQQNATVDETTQRTNQVDAQTLADL
jgi:peptidyl-prolyl isomerase E (cyclophilin E)